MDKPHTAETIICGAVQQCLVISACQHKSLSDGHRHSVHGNTVYDTLVQSTFVNGVLQPCPHGRNDAALNRLPEEIARAMCGGRLHELTSATPSDSEVPTIIPESMMIGLKQTETFALTFVTAGIVGGTLFSDEGRSIR